MKKEQVKSLIENCDEIKYYNGNMATDIKYEAIDEVIGI